MFPLLGKKILQFNVQKMSLPGPTKLPLSEFWKLFEEVLGWLWDQHFLICLSLDEIFRHFKIYFRFLG